jgi:GT2 family glycosyltransferase
LTVAIVSHGLDVQYLARTVGSLESAVAHTGEQAQLIVVDNGPALSGRTRQIKAALALWRGPREILSGQGNFGFGRGHNLALTKSPGEFHLVLNPDVELAPESLAKGLAFLREHPDCGMITAAVKHPEGGLQYLCKRYPSVLDLGLRGFAPGSMRRLFAERLARYEMRDLINDRDTVWDPPIVSGCFMLWRTATLRALGGFDPGYFLYFEDFDLSLRAASHTRLVYLPTMSIVHYGGEASRKGLTHIRYFVASAYRFFATHGWKLC